MVDFVRHEGSGWSPVSSGERSALIPAVGWAIRKPPEQPFSALRYRNVTRLSLSAFSTTVNDDIAIAAPANIGDIRMPNAG